MRAQLIRKWNGFPKETGSSTMEAFFCQWLYWIPLQGQWAILKAISSIAPPPPCHHLSIACSLFFLSSRSLGLICATVSLDPPHPHPAPLLCFVQNADFTILHIDSLRRNHQLLCMLGLFNDRTEETESTVTHCLAHSWPAVSVVNFSLRQQYLIFSILCLCMDTFTFTLTAQVLHKKKKDQKERLLILYSFCFSVIPFVGQVKVVSLHPVLLALLGRAPVFSSEVL